MNDLSIFTNQELPEEVIKDEAGYSISFRKISGTHYSFCLNTIQSNEGKDSLPKQVTSILGRKKTSFLGIDFYAKVIGKAILLVQSPEWEEVKEALTHAHENRKKVMRYCKDIGNKFAFSVTEVIGGVSSSITIEGVSYAQTALNQKVGKALLMKELVKCLEL
jgi:hypothetical protein